MPTKANGPLMEDYMRALKAAKKMGVKAVRVEVGNGSSITMLLDDASIANWASPAPEKPKARWGEPLEQAPSRPRLPRHNNPEAQEVFNEVETIFRTGVLPWDVPYRRIVDELARRGYTRLDGEPLIVKRLSRLLREKGFDCQQFAPEALREKWAREREAFLRRWVEYEATRA